MATRFNSITSSQLSGEPYLNPRREDTARRAWN
jgi:hypothetical protein